MIGVYHYTELMNKTPTVQTPISQIDERDTMFARMARKQGNYAYRDYYRTNPQLKQKDDHLRSLPPLLKRGGKFYDSIITNNAKRLFNSIDEINIDELTINNYLKRIKSSGSISESLRNIILKLGGVAVGITDLDSKFIYKFKGRFDSEYGKRIKLNHPTAILFLVEMDYLNMQFAPKAHTIFESANQYYNAALISKILEKIIIQLGYDAKAHYDAHYDVILPPLAVQAGLGELGRNNILIADKYGSRVRIGAITTDLPLITNKPISLGADKFCSVCKKCSENCPSKALEMDDKIEVNGVHKWPTNIENCYTIWRKYGTDCGICMAVCPFSHKNNFIHNGIRLIVRNFPILNRFLVHMDNLIYGKKWKSK